MKLFTILFVALAFSFSSCNQNSKPCEHSHEDGVHDHSGHDHGHHEGHDHGDEEGQNQDADNHEGHEHSSDSAE